MLSTRSGVAQSFFVPSLVEDVEDTRAMSTGSNRIVANNDVNVIIVTVETTAERSRGVWYV